MAGLKDLEMSLRETENSDDETKTPDVVYCPTSYTAQGRTNDVLGGGKSWSRYKPTLANFMPMRIEAATKISNGERKVGSRIDGAGCFSFITFSWVFPYLWATLRGQQPPEEEDSVWECSVYDSTGVNSARMGHLWSEELKLAEGDGRPPSLTRVIMRFMLTRLIVACFVFFFCLVFGFIGPTCLVRALIAYAEAGEDRTTFGLSLAFALLCIEMARVLSYGATWAISYRTGLRARAGVLGLLYKKLIKLRNLQGHKIGEIINVYANDGQRIFDAVVFAPLVLMGPFVLIGGIIYLLLIIGPWSLLGLLVFVVFDILQVYLGKSMVKYRKMAVEETEKRMSRIVEIFNCIRLIKMYTWEKVFRDIVLAHRDIEKKSLWKAGIAQSLAVAAGPAVPIVATILTFLAYIGTGHTLLASEAFSVITVFFVMVFGIRMIPYGARYGAEAYVSLKKIQGILLLDTIGGAWPSPANQSLALVLQDASFEIDEVENSEKNETSTRQKDSVTSEKEPLTNGHLNEEAEKTVFSRLGKINLVIEKKQLVGVCGSVGSGKSMLLDAVIGQLVHKDGNVMLNGALAYAAQEPWILNGTLKENVLFGEIFNAQRYYKVLSACSLTEDINEFADGDDVQIGERGVMISGGQKARVSLARALYAHGRDVYLLDSVLTALDVHVANDVFQYAIRGFLKGKTVLLVTNNIQYLSDCDQIVFMSQGQVLDQGPYRAVRSRCQEFANFCRAQSHSQEPPKIEQILSGDRGQKNRVDQSTESIERSAINSDGDEYSMVDVLVSPKVLRKHIQADVHRRTWSHNESTFSLPETTDELSSECPFSRDKFRTSSIVPADSLLDIPKALEDEKQRCLPEEEDLGLATLSSLIYTTYMKAAGGYFLSLLCFLSFLLTVAASLFCTIWLAYWLKKREQNEVQNLEQSFASEEAALLLSDGTGANGTGLANSKNLLENSPLSAATSEENLSFYMGIYGLALVLAVLTSFGKAFFFVKLSLNASTWLHNEMFRTLLHGTMEFFDVTPNGRITNRFSKDIDEIDTKLPFTAETFLQNLLTVTGSLIVIAWVFPWFLIAAIPIGLVFALFVASFRAGIRSLKRAENISRSPLFGHISATLSGLSTIHAFEQIPRFSEKCKHLLDNNSGAIFMFQGAMRWLAVWLDLIVVLITFATSLLIVFMSGTVEPAYAGMALAFAIQLSGIFQFTVRLHSELESKMISVERVKYYIDNIEQEGPWYSTTSTPPEDWPVLGRVMFKDVRFNLDPMNQYTDDRLWSALEQVQIKEMISKTPQGLMSKVTEGGKNYSTGERQLLCMARALLKNVRVLLVDEATSNVDSETDLKVQACLERTFNDCTVLLIAHRFQSVLASDRILFMDGGKVLEYGKPQVLLQDQKSNFYQMVHRNVQRKSTL